MAAAAATVRQALRWLALAAEGASRSRLWQNALFQAAVLPLVIVQLRRWFQALTQSLTDCIFTQVRFREDGELHSYISHKLQNSRAGFRISTLDEEHGAAEILQENNVELFAYTLRARGAAPLHVTHMPLEAASSWLWLAAEKTAPWWSLPIVWICPENVDSPLWASLPKFVKTLFESATSFMRSFMTLPEGDEENRHRSNRLVVSTFRWHSGLVDQVANDAARFGEQSRTRSCPILHLRSDGVRAIVAPPRKMSTVVLASEGEALLADIGGFFARREWYRENDLPYQRIYLLHGPPGNGKSSFLQALAILFSMPFFYLELANKQLTLEGLRNMLKDNTLQSRCILALEDAESVFKKATPAAEAAAAEREAERLERMFTQKQAQQGAASDVSGQAAALAAHYGVTIEDFTSLVSGDLNPPNGRLIFFTTNHVDRMHSELLRLVDEQGMRVNFPNADSGVIQGMWAQFFAQYQPQAAQQWDRFQQEYARRFGSHSRICSAAAVQEYLMGFRTDPELAAHPTSVAQLLPTESPDSDLQHDDKTSPSLIVEKQEREVAPKPSFDASSVLAVANGVMSRESGGEKGADVRASRSRWWAAVTVVPCLGFILWRKIYRAYNLHMRRATFTSVVLLLLASLRAEHGRIAQGAATAGAAVVWVVLSQLWDFVDRSVWATYVLPVGRDEDAGTWVIDALRAQLARGGADRLDALPRTDIERLESAVRTIELKSSRFAGLSTQHLPLEPKIQSKAYRLCLVPLAGEKDGRVHTVWVKQQDQQVTMRFLQGARGWLPTPWMNPMAAHIIAQSTVQRARQAFCTARCRHTNVYRFSVRRQCWQKDKPPPERLREISFIAPSDALDDCIAQQTLADDAIEFFGLRQWYRERGIPYRRGYLLHGSPGCGKSYFVRKLAAAAGVPIYVLDIGKTSTMTNESLPAHMHAVESNAIVVLRNIDAFVGNRAMAGVSKELTFSGLLNVLDGALGANKGLIMILTTNRFDRLRQDTQSADALLRPGRVSLLGHFGNPTAAQLRVYVTRLFTPHDGAGHGAEEMGGTKALAATAAESFVVAIKEAFPNGVSPAVVSMDNARAALSKTAEAATAMIQQNEVWRCPWSWQETKGVLMQPAARNVVELLRPRASERDVHDRDGQTSLDSRIEDVRAAWAELIQEFAKNVQATRRARLAKQLEQHAVVLKRELRRPTDVASERQERERGASDAESLLQELSHPAVGLATEALLAEEPALRRIVELVREQILRLRRGEVDTKENHGTTAASVVCPHCGSELARQALRGNYCDSPNCGAPPAWRCPTPGCDFDLCQSCHELAADSA